jgi:RNA polymerase sigma factor (sigma-70 family)
MSRITVQSGPEHEEAPPGRSGREDAELLSAYVGGDEEAFETLVKRYFGLVYASIRRRLKDPSLAEEATQSTFIILARKARALSNGVQLRAWLLKTSHFVSNDALKSQRRRREHEEALEFHPETEVAESTGDRVAAGEFLEQALLKLPAVDQACLVARFYEGRTFKELAEILGISEDGAQKKVSRLLQKLRHYVTKRGLKISDVTLSGLLWSFWTPPAPASVMHSSLRVVILPALHGKLSSGLAVTLASRNLRLLARRRWLLLGAKVALPLLLLGGGWMSWVSFHGSWPHDPSIEALGKAWSVVVLRAAAAKQTYQRAPVPNTPEFQAYMNELQFVVKETDRISAQLQGRLKPGEDRRQLAEFLTVEMRETLGLNPAQQKQLFNYIREGLSKRATLKEAMQAMAQSTSAETSQVKAYLSPKQRQVFDRVYGADGLCLFQYLKVAPA